MNTSPGISARFTLIFVALAFSLFFFTEARAGSFTLTGSPAVARQLATLTVLTNGTALLAGGDTLGNGELSDAELYNPATHSWTNTGSLNTPRAEHTATLLPNGRVLVTGGSTNTQNFPNDATASAEIYNPNTGVWTNAAPMHEPLASQTATLLPNGHVLVVGAFYDGANFNADAEIYDPASNIWTTAATPNDARINHCALMLPNGLVLVAGGQINNSILGTAELYDPANDTWTETGPLTAPRYSFAITLLPNGTVLAAGGIGSEIYRPINEPPAPPNVSNAEIYDPNAGVWTNTADMTFDHDGNTATLLTNGTVLVAGQSFFTTFNQGAEIYIPSNGVWRMTGSMTDGRGYQSAALLPDGHVLMVQGFDDDQTQQSAELYDPSAGGWFGTTPLVTHRTSQTATLLPNGKVMIAGGFSDILSNDDLLNFTITNSELFDPSTGIWTATGSMAAAREGHTATLLADGRVLVAGGDSAEGASSLLNSCELYSPTTGSWTNTGPLNDGRMNQTATLLHNGKVLIVCGSVVGLSGNVVTSAEIYDPTAGIWKYCAPPNQPRKYHTATLLANGKVLIAGGEEFTDVGVALLNSAEIYDPASDTWSLTGSMHQARISHTATLLPDGRVLVAGGGGAQ